MSSYAYGLAPAGRVSRPGPRLIEHEHHVVYENEFGYSAWPTILQAKNGELLVAFDEKIRRPTRIDMDPSFFAMLTRSSDGGKTWNKSGPIGGYRNIGVEAIGAVVLRNGDILAQCYHPRYWSESQARKRFTNPSKTLGVHHWKEYPWYREDGNFNYIYRSTDNGHTWSAPVSLNASPYRMAYMLRSAAELADGSLVLPCADDSFDSGRAFVMFSRDGGFTWVNPTAITRDPRVFFTEPALLLLPDGKLLAMVRADRKGYLYQADSKDGGQTWSEARETPMWGLPAHLLLLSNGNILCVYGYRRKPFGVRACLSYNGGRSWDIENELILRDDFPNADVGYPTSVQFNDGRILTVYYDEVHLRNPTVAGSGVARIEASLYRIAAG